MGGKYALEPYVSGLAVFSLSLARGLATWCIEIQKAACPQHPVGGGAFTCDCGS